MKPKGLFLILVFIYSLIGTTTSWSSDHDDGETDIKGRNLNLTDLYVFREGDQTGSDGDNSNLILIMNTNPRSVARQQYYFSTQARYEFHITRLSDKNAAVTGSDDVILRFKPPLLPAEKSFELWMLPGKDQAPVSLGLLPTSGVKTLKLDEGKLKILKEASGLAVSLEPTGGSPTGAPTGPILYQGVLVSLG